MKRIAVLTSGGDSPGMNAAIRAVVRCAIDKEMEVYGITRGYEGLLDGEIRQMDRNSVGDILHRGGTILKTARSERFRTAEGVKKGAEMLHTFGIEGLVVIGGDGSMRGARELSSHGIKVMCLPGTIDNDLNYTDYTIGFDTAVNTVLEAISKLRDTSSAHDRTTVIEVMGRHCGDIALHAGLAGGAEAVLVPEVPVDINAICRHIIEGSHRGKLHSIVIKAEGVEISSGELARTIESRTGKEARKVVLGYLQRGGNPTLSDRKLATLTGAKAVDLLYEDSASKAIGITRGEVMAYDLEEAMALPKEFDQKLYDLISILSK
ncbi:MAG: 6-phosphofructokinase [Firmicutes bacterium]|nr:6-phosphofructokinase [Bacillota bacterium]